MNIVSFYGGHSFSVRKETESAMIDEVNWSYRNKPSSPYTILYIRIAPANSLLTWKTSSAAILFQAYHIHKIMEDFNGSLVNKSCNLKDEIEKLPQELRMFWIDRKFISFLDKFNYNKRFHWQKSEEKYFHKWRK